MNSSSPKKNDKTLTFAREIAKYFMDFLETDFHKRRHPKRSVKFKDSNNLLVGLNINKYPAFQKLIWGAISNAFGSNALKSVKKGNYKAKVPRSLLDLVKIKIEGITEKKVGDITKQISKKLEKFSSVYKKEYDKCLVFSLESITEIIKENFVLPFIESIEKSLENSNLLDENTRYLMEQELTDIFVKSLENKVSEILKLLISEKEVEPIQEIKSVFSVKDIKTIILDFFEDFKIADLFLDILEMNRNKNILDKQEFYLYFCDITFNKVKYPIFYIPFEVIVGGDSIKIDFDAQVYINKKALEYTIQEFNKLRDKKGHLKEDTERIMYLAEGQESLISKTQDLLSELVNVFELNSDIDIKSIIPQKASSSLVHISNNCFISLFDKSDEALINDYEEILQLLSTEDSVLANVFHELIGDFLNKEPLVLNREIDNEWDEAEISEKLVYPSPIPLNSEQRKILAAIKKKDCKYITVQGPPGTGKSHTITAIVFDAILENKSVLVLSDKKEALDVVEDKITETMNKVRVDENFQNPILRLGKTGSTYSKILSLSSIKGITQHFKAVKKDYNLLEERINKTSNSLKEDLEAEALIYNELDIRELKECLNLENYYNKEGCLIDMQEALRQPEATSQLEEFRRIFLKFKEELLKKERFVEFFEFVGFPINFFKSLDDFVKFLQFIQEILKDADKLKKEFSDTTKILDYFRNFSDSKLKKLEQFLDDYQELKSGVFGYLFQGKRVNLLNIKFKKVFPSSKFDSPHNKLEEIKKALEIFRFVTDSAKTFINGDYLKVLHRLTLDSHYYDISKELIKLIQDIKYLQDNSVNYQKTFKKIKFDSSSFECLYNNGLVNFSEESFNKIIRFLFLQQKITNSFKNIPQDSYINQKGNIEDLVATKMTYLLDSRLVDFYDENRATAKVLREIIKAKQRFPKEEFVKLKSAFPCILAGIRDYAEYIPLEPEIFDLVIIDEASQVSIAQAFPALLRAKQIIILGDKKQFSNVKSYQARTDTNREYLSSLSSVFKRNISKELTKIKRLEKFNIKTSILEFFEFISNYNIQLLKYFRGYKEIISYSNKFFYEDSLQVMKIRGKSIDKVIKFSFVKHDGKTESIPNTNKLEIDFVISELKTLKAKQERPSVGIITPHTNQQKMLIDAIGKLPEKDFFFDKLKLKIMTFDTCQGEERDVIFYSMVATEAEDRLWGVFIKDLEKVNSEEEGRIKAQRLNVGFSRAKECVHFVLSKDLTEFNGAIGEAIRHYAFTIEEAKKEKSVEQVDKKSKMEPQVLNWFYQTAFWKENNKRIELLPQFEIGKYLKQLDRAYVHPAYVVDFLVIYEDESNKRHNIIIEYDGFDGHFKNKERVNKFNYKSYYSEDDVYRQKVLESYGYNFLRMNKFNIGDNPVSTLNKRIQQLLGSNQENDFLDHIHNTVEGLKNGKFKECPKCKKVKSIQSFKDDELITGYGRFCNQCKKVSRQPRRFQPAREVEVIESVTCPRCKSGMVLRTGRHGQFYGCSKFPYCRGTRQLD